jgi:Ca2+-binding RTX toxin-like protein
MDPMMGGGMMGGGMMDPMMGGGMMGGGMMDPMMGGGMMGGGMMGGGMMGAGAVMAAGSGGMAIGLGSGVIYMSGTPLEAAHLHVGSIFTPGLYMPPADDHDPLPGDEYNPYISDVYVDPAVEASFSEVVTATTGNDTLTGGAGNTNFTMSQGTTLGGTDTVTDNGGTDGMTFENLNNTNLKLVLATPDTITVKEGITFDQGTITGSVSFSNIENLYLQDSVGGVSDRLAVPLAGSGTNAIIAGTSAGDTITLASATYDYSVIWGQGGADTITGGSGGDTIYGQAGIDTITPNGGQDNIYLGIAGDADVIIIEDDAHYGANQAAQKHEVVRQFITGEDKMKFSHGDIAGIDAGTNMSSYGSSKTGATVIVDAPGSTWGGNVVAGHTAQRFLYNSSSGELYYDGDGSTTTISAILVANLFSDTANTAVNLAAGDLDIIA